MKVIAKTTELTHDEWLDLRKTGIGGSDAGTILGVNPYSSPYALWADKTGLVENVFKGNAATEWGNRLERTVAEAFAEQSGCAVVEWPVMLQGRNTWELANVDFFIVEPSEVTPAGQVTSVDSEPNNISAILECKTTGIVGKGNAKGWDNNQVPASYYWQGAHYAMVTGISQVYFACLIGGQGIVVRSRDYTAECLAGLRDAETSFWELVEKKSPPEFTGADAEFEVLKSLYPSSTGTSVEVSEFIVDCLSEYRMAKQEAEEAEAAVKAIRIELEAAIADADEATWNGQALYTYKSNKVGEQFDTKRFKEENPELWAQYVTERKGARVLRIKGE